MGLGHEQGDPSGCGGVGMLKWGYWGWPVGDGQKCARCGDYPEGYCGEGVGWDGKW